MSFVEKIWYNIHENVTEDNNKRDILKGEQNEKN